MSETNNTPETTEQKILVREDGTQYTVEPFSLAKTKEVADRFRGVHTIQIPLPVAVKGDLEQTLRNLRAFVAEGADFAEVLVAKFNGQGLRLDLQKTAKDFLAPRGTDDTETIEVEGEQVLTRDAPVEAMLAQAQMVVDAERLGAPRKRGTGAAKGKVAQAEAKAAKTASTAVQMYRDLPKEMRQNYRQALIDTGNVTEAELDAVDQELAGQEPTSGKGRRG